MSATKRKIYEALVEGATAGLSDDALFDFVVRAEPKANSKRIVRAALLSLSDPALSNRNILNVIYSLAIKHRLADIFDDDADDFDILAPTFATTSAVSSADKSPSPAPAPRKKRSK